MIVLAKQLAHAHTHSQHDSKFYLTKNKWHNSVALEFITNENGKTHSAAPVSTRERNAAPCRCFTNFPMGIFPLGREVEGNCC